MSVNFPTLENFVGMLYFGKIDIPKNWKHIFLLFVLSMISFAPLYLFAFVFCYNILNINSNTSHLWRLRRDGKICRHEEGNAFRVNSREDRNDKIFNIIITTVLTYEGSWMKMSNEQLGEGDFLSKGVDYEIPRSKAISAIPVQEKDILDCGIPVNFTYYDYLIGVGQRLAHPLVPEPEVAYLFLKNKAEKSLRTFDINVLERRLKKAKKEKPISVSLYNQIGNYWRIKGDARQSIECFRRALSISPTNAEVLLNLARVLFSLQYLDDAIHLTKSEISRGVKSITLISLKLEEEIHSNLFIIGLMHGKVVSDPKYTTDNANNY